MSRRSTISRSRFRRIAKWTGTAICGLILLAAAACLKWRFLWIDGGGWLISLETASIKTGWGPMRADDRTEFILSRPFASWFELRDFWRTNFSAGPEYRRHSMLIGRMRFTDWIELPLWIPFVLAAVPTGLMWWQDRRGGRPGFCRRCGYDLTGNLSGRCPECGGAIGTPCARQEAANQRAAG